MKNYLFALFFIVMAVMGLLMAVMRFGHFPDASGVVASAWRGVPSLFFGVFYGAMAVVKIKEIREDRARNLS